MTTYYEILEVKNNASEAEIRKAYYKLSRTHHPDRHGDEQKSAAINMAYEVLSKPDLRLKYDAQLMLDGLFGDAKLLVKRIYDNKEWIKMSLCVSMGSLIGGLVTMPFSTTISYKLLWTSLAINSYLGYRLVSAVLDVRKQVAVGKNSFFQPANASSFLQLTDYPHQSSDAVLPPQQ